MARKFATSLTRSEMEQARAFERAGLTTISQAVKAFERGESATIALWTKQLKEKK